MARVFTFVMIAVGLMVMFQVLGIEVGLDPIANIFGLINGEISGSDFFLELFGSTVGILTGIGLAGGIVATLFIGSSRENFILLPLILGVLGALVGVFQGIIIYGNSGAIPGWMGNIIFVMLGAFLVGYIVSLAEFFRGTA